MESIWKYTLEITDLQTVEMPSGAIILSVDNQDGSLCLWALVDTEAAKEEVCIEIIGTGNPVFSATRQFIGTVLMGSLVWHVFERPN